MSNLLKLSLLCALLIAPLGCAPQEVGEDCDEVGDTDECEDDAICTNVGDSEDEGVCFWICDSDAECATTHACNGVAGTNIKSCQPK